MRPYGQRLLSILTGVSPGRHTASMSLHTGLAQPHRLCWRGPAVCSSPSVLGGRYLISPVLTSELSAASHCLPGGDQTSAGERQPSTTWPWDLPNFFSQRATVSVLPANFLHCQYSLHFRPATLGLRFVLSAVALRRHQSVARHRLCVPEAPSLRRVSSRGDGGASRGSWHLPAPSLPPHKGTPVERFQNPQLKEHPSRPVEGPETSRSGWHRSQLKAVNSAVGWQGAGLGGAEPAPWMVFRNQVRLLAAVTKCSILFNFHSVFLR